MAAMVSPVPPTPSRPGLDEIIRLENGSATGATVGEPIRVTDGPGATSRFSGPDAPIAWALAT